MCGRKTLTKRKIEIIQKMLVDDWNDEWIPSYNIAPTQNTPILVYIRSPYSPRLYSSTTS